jgi:hypothetical protein
MKAQEVIRNKLESEGRSQRSLAIELGITPQTMTSRVDPAKGTLGVDKVSQTLDALGYKLVVMPKDYETDEPIITE